MRPASAPLVLALLASACRSEPDFDTRYNAQAAAMNAAAANMQAELDSQFNAARAAGSGTDNSGAAPAGGKP